MPFDEVEFGGASYGQFGFDDTPSTKPRWTKTRPRDENVVDDFGPFSTNVSGKFKALAASKRAHNTFQFDTHNKKYESSFEPKEFGARTEAPIDASDSDSDSNEMKKLRGPRVPKDGKKESLERWAAEVSERRARIQEENDTIGSDSVKLIDHRTQFRYESVRKHMVENVKNHSISQLDYETFYNPLGFDWLKPDDIRLLAVLTRYAEGDRMFEPDDFSIVHAYAHELDLRQQLNTLYIDADSGWTRTTQYNNENKILFQEMCSVLPHIIDITRDPIAESNDPPGPRSLTDSETILAQKVALNLSTGEWDIHSIRAVDEREPTVRFNRVRESLELYSQPTLRVFVEDIVYTTSARTLRPELIVTGITNDAETPRTVVLHMLGFRPYMYVTVPETFSSMQCDDMFHDLNAVLASRYARIDLNKQAKVDSKGSLEENTIRAALVSAWQSYRTQNMTGDKETLAVLSVEYTEKIPHHGWRKKREVPMMKITYAHPFMEKNVRDAVMALHSTDSMGEQVEARLVVSAPSFPQLCNFHEIKFNPVMRFLCDMQPDGLSAAQWISIPTAKCAFARSVPYGYDVNDVPWPDNVKKSVRSDYRVNIEAYVDRKDVVIHPSDTADENASIGNMRMVIYDCEMPNQTNGEFPSFERSGVAQISLVVVNFSKITEIYRKIICVGTCRPIANCEVIECSDEMRLYEAFAEQILTIDPDITVTYNGNGFDHGYLYNRSEYLRAQGHHFQSFNVSVLLGKSKTMFMEKPHSVWKSTLPVIPDPVNALICSNNPMHGLGRKKGQNVSGVFAHVFNSQARGTVVSIRSVIFGVITIDLMELMRNTTKHASYGLNNISSAYGLGTKLDINHSLVYGMHTAGPTTRGKLAAYAIQDSILPVKIIDKCKTIQGYVAMARVCGVTLPSLWINGQQAKVSSQIVRFSNRVNVVISAKEPRIYPNGYVGGLVLPPLKGLCEMLTLVLDFASLYPSIIVSMNLCYTTLIPKEKEAEYLSMHGPETYYRSEQGHMFTNLYEGILPRILKKLWKGRKAAKKLMEAAATASDYEREAVYNALQLEIKVSMNSVYGFCGAVLGLMPCIEISETVTTRGQFLIRLTWDYLEKHFANRYMIRDRLSSFAQFTPVLQTRLVHLFDELCKAPQYKEINDDEKIAFVAAKEPEALDVEYDENKAMTGSQERISEYLRMKAAAKTGTANVGRKRLAEAAAATRVVATKTDENGIVKKIVKQSTLLSVFKQKNRVGENDNDNGNGNDGYEKYSVDQRRRGLETYSRKYDPVRLKVIYGDTDSVMTRTPCDRGNKELAAGLGKMCELIVNKELFDDMETVEQEFEKIIENFLLVGKKCYAGIELTGLKYEFDSGKITSVKVDKPKTTMPPDSEYSGAPVTKISFKGLEMVRRDNNAFLRSVGFWTSYKVIVENDIESALVYVKREIARLKSGKVPISKLIMSKGYNKRATEYAAQGMKNSNGKARSLPPHVAFVERHNQQNPTHPITVGSRVFFLNTATSSGLKSDGVNDVFVTCWKGIPLDIQHYMTKTLDCVSRLLVHIIGPSRTAQLHAECKLVPTVKAVSEFALLNADRQLRISVNPEIFDAKMLQSFMDMDMDTVARVRKDAVTALRRASPPDVKYDEDGYVVEPRHANSSNMLTTMLKTTQKCAVCAMAPKENTRWYFGVCIECLGRVKYEMMSVAEEKDMSPQCQNAFRAFRTYNEELEMLELQHGSFQKIWKKCIDCSKTNEQNPQTCESRDCSNLIDRFSSYQQIVKTHVSIARKGNICPPSDLDYELFAHRF